MALPTIETPKYHLTIPSTGELLEYRPFLVKEEKVLLIAQEANTQAALISATKDIIKACTFNKVDLYSLTMSDLEYMLLQIRAKSVGEKSTIRVKCDQCDEYVDVDIDLTTVNVSSNKEKIDNTIQLTDTVGITLKQPSLKDVERASKNKGSNAITDGVVSVIESIYDQNDVYPLEQATIKEVDEFIDSLNSAQIQKIQEWVETIPQLQHEINFTCKNGHENTRILKGLNDFFA